MEDCVAETRVGDYIFIVTEKTLFNLKIKKTYKKKLQKKIIFYLKDFTFYKYICKMYTLADIFARAVFNVTKSRK